MKPKFLFAFVLILLIFHGALSIIIGWESNNQGEFYDTITFKIDYFYILTKLFFYPVVLSLIVLLVCFLRKMK